MTGATAALMALQVRRAAPAVALTLVGAWCLAWWLGPPPARPDAAAAPRGTVAPEGAWAAARERLERAGSLRRDGRVEEALVEYLAVGDALHVRADDREEARMWSARLRLERGEASGFVDLERWIDGRPDPARLARVVLLLRRTQRGDGDVATRARAASLEARALGWLARMARVHDAHGVRSRRWLRRLKRAAR